MQRIKINLKNPKKETLDHAAFILKSGGLIICPSDTSYLIGVDATNDTSVETLYKMKERGFGKPIHVVVTGFEMARKYVKFTPATKKLSQVFLPGPLTLVLEKTDSNLAQNLTGSEKTLGVRIPSLKLNRYLADKLGGPYTATSANKSNTPDSYSIKQVSSQFSKQDIRNIDLILDAGDLEKVLPSTVADFPNNHPRVLREGPISTSDIKKVLS